MKGKQGWEWKISRRKVVRSYVRVMTVCLNLRFLGVASILGFLLLPPVMQICGKRVHLVMYGIDGVL